MMLTKTDKQWLVSLAKVIVYCIGILIDYDKYKSKEKDLDENLDVLIDI